MTSADRVTARFLVGAFVTTLTLGAGSGMFYLWRIGAGADVPVSHRQLHGHSQLLGFAALFLMGVAFRLLPRRFDVPPAPERLQNAVFWLMASGVVLRNVGQPFAFFAAGRALAFLSGLLEAGSGVLFALYVFEALRHRKEPTIPFLLAGNAFLLAGLAISVVQGAWIAGQRDATLPASLTEPFHAALLHGFLMSWVFGFSLLMVPMLCRTGPPRPWTSRATLGLLSAGVTLSLTTALPPAAPYAPTLRDAGTVLTAMAALVFGAGIGVPWRRPQAVPPPPANAPVRVAFGALALWGLVSLGAVAGTRLTSFPAQNPWWNDAARHLFTIGFLTLLIVGIGTRLMVPFSGRPLWSERAARASWILVAGGAALRLLEYPGIFWPAWYRAGSLMGIPVVAGLALFLVNLVKTARTPPESPVPPNTLPARHGGPAVPADRT